MILMKLTKALTLVAALGVATSLNAADKIVAGPKGGRLLETTPQKTEFVVNEDRTVEINFYDATLKAVAPTGEVVAVTAEVRGGRTALALEKTATGYVSKSALPEGEPYRVVVQVRANADARPQNFRIELNMEKCAECLHPEYACICGH